MARSGGPKHKPLELKRIQGTYRADRAPAVEIQAIKAEPSLPFAVEPLVEEWFDRFVSYMKMENRGSKSDETILWLTARRCAEIQILDFEISLNGRTYFSEKDQKLRANPAVQQRSAAEKQLQALLSELGLTPSSRSRVSADMAPAKSNGWEDFDQAVN